MSEGKRRKAPVYVRLRRGKEGGCLRQLPSSLCSRLHCVTPRRVDAATLNIQRSTLNKGGRTEFNHGCTQINADFNTKTEGQVQKPEGRGRELSQKGFHTEGNKGNKVRKTISLLRSLRWLLWVFNREWTSQMLSPELATNGHAYRIFSRFQTSLLPATDHLRLPRSHKATSSWVIKSYATRVWPS